MQNFPIKIPKIHRELFIKIMRIMNVTAIFMTVACLQLSAKSYSQNVTVSGKNLSIEKAFSSIKTQTGYTFWYNVELVEKAKKLDVSIRNNH